MSFFQALRKAIFQQDNAQFHIAGIVWTFLDTENVWLLPWTTPSTYLSSIENIWSMVAERLVRYHTPVTTVDELRHLVENVWATVPVHAIQSQYNSMPRCITAVIADGSLLF